MKRLITKMSLIILIIIAICFLISLNVLAKETDETQVIKMEDGNYVVYVKDLIESDGFKYVLSEKVDLDENDSILIYINSVVDNSDEKNQVAFIEKEKITDSDGKIVDNINMYINNKVYNIDIKNAFDINMMKEVEETTKRINTDLKTDIEQRKEEVNGIMYTETVGGLEISDKDKSKYKYEYISVKLPSKDYSDLQDLADTMNSKYKEMNMYEKIEIAKEFYEIYNKLINSASWKTINNYLIKQPIDAQNGDKYVVLLKKIDKDNDVIYDVKFLVSYRQDEQEKIPAKTETRKVSETSKLPITNDSMMLYIIFLVILCTILIVFIKYKTSRRQGKH